MIGNNYKLDGINIEKKTNDFSIYLDDNLNPRGLESSEQRINIDNFHGVLTSATYARGRTIVISGLIETHNDRKGLGLGMNFLDNLFRLQNNPSILELRTFTFTDDIENNWKIGVKIQTPIIYDLFEDDSWHIYRKFRVVLFAPDGAYLSETEIQKLGGKSGFINGASLETGIVLGNGGTSLSEGSENFIISEQSSGNQLVYPVITINILQNLNNFLKVTNNSIGASIILEGEYLIGDLIVVDMKEETIYKNGDNIIQEKIYGDFFNLGTEDYLEVYDLDERYKSNKLEFSILYNDILL